MEEAEAEEKLEDSEETNMSKQEGVNISAEIFE